MNRRLRRNDFANPNSQQLYGAAVGALLLAGAVVVSTAIGCGWSFVNEHSVRFSGFTSPGDFTRLPPLPIKPDARRGASSFPRTQDGDQEAKYEAEELRRKGMDEVWEQASEAEEKGDFAQTGRLLREYLQRSSATFDNWSSNDNGSQQRRNSAIDRLDAITALGQGARASDLSVYLDARRRFDLVTQAVSGEFYLRQRFPSSSAPQGDESSAKRFTYADQLHTLLAVAARRPALADNAAYLSAAILYCEGNIDAAAKAFYELAAKYQHSEKREAALLMAGRVGIKRFEQSLLEADSELEQARLKARMSARQALRQCLRDYPRGRYALDARGWLAHLALLEGNRAAALAEYYRILSEAGDERTRGSQLVSLKLTRRHASDEEMRQVEADLADEPAAALTYAYHNLYNYAPRAGFYLLDDTGQPHEMDEQIKKDLSQQAERQEQARIVSFASGLMQRYPRAAVGGGFALRLAQAQLEMGEHKPALRSAARALQIGVKDRERTEALWVKGSSEWGLRYYAAARRTLKQLVAEFPRSDLAEGAGRLIAMAAEDAGDLDGALEQYIALNYEDDFAYFVDVLMTPEQLAGFIARHPDSPRLNDLNYALAVRYLRARRWAEACAALERVKVTEEDYAEVFSYVEKSDDPVEFRSKGRTAKTPSDSRGIAARWIWRDLKTARDLNRMESEAAWAKGDEAKAERLYQLASFLYQGSSLLFYNPSIWGGARHYKLEELESGNGYRAPGEAQLLWRHAMEHEPVAQALDIYLDVVRRFPNTQAARDALYTAAVCHERLSDYNNHWRNVYGMGLHAGARMVTYEDVQQAYPDYQLPRGTIGWEPVTRTVNGGPALAEAPKPKPRPTWRSRVKQRLANLAVEFRQKQRDVDARFMDSTGRLVTGLIYSLVALGLLAACYFAVVVLYLRNQRPMFAPMLEEEGIASTASDPPTSSTDSRVEKIINY